MADSKSAGPKDENVEKIRDILFGSQSREFDRRMSELDARIEAMGQGLKADMDKRMGALESFTKRELEKLTERLKTEQSERFEELKSLEREVRDSHKDQLKRVAQLDSQLAKDALELRSSMEEQSRQHAALLSEAEARLRDALKQAHAQLSDGKVARLDLADLLSEVALKLKREFDLNA